MTELKPCPFCGGEVIEYVRRDFAYIGCVRCSVAMQEGESKQELIERWNSRAEVDEIFKLEKLLKKAEIPYFMINRLNGYQIFYPDVADKVCTITQGKKDEKLKIEGLEMQGEVVRRLIGEAVRLTASEAYRRIREHYEGGRNETR